MDKYVGRFLESVLAQTYNTIELIIVNDGSTDNSETIIKNYFSKFQNRDITVKYILKENEGLGAAINAGLKVFAGDYLIWPDSDDFMSENLIEEMVSFLEKNSEYGLVRTNVNMYYEENDTLKVYDTIFNQNNKRKLEEDLFEILIFEKKGVSFCPGSYMIRTSIFLKANPTRHIYPCRRAQNWQMLLPVMYISKCGYIDKPLHNYVIRSNSMSHTDDTLQKELQRCVEHEDVLLQTIKGINGLDKMKYEKLIRDKYHLKRFRLSLSFNDRKMAQYYYGILKRNKLLNTYFIVCYYLMYYGNNFFIILKKIRKKIRY
jgi:glycosyltransferase involved in cell wall biosynthesis